MRGVGNVREGGKTRYPWGTMQNLPGAPSAPNFMSDQPVEQDFLWSGAYSRALADFLTNEGTQPPLVLGIDGKRGSGKTSLMRALRRRLDPDFDLPSIKTRRMTVGRFQKHLQTEDPEAKMNLSLGSKPFTVWFNAWKHSRDEHLWSALVRTVIQQVTDQVDPVEREDFLLRLNLRRIDREKVRRRIRRTFFNQLLPWLVLQILMLLAVAFEIFEARMGHRTMVSLSAIPACGMVYKWWQAKRKPLSVDLQLDKYVKEPRYEEKVGFQAEVEEDFRRVQETLGAQHRLVIFIDDLDRCSPAKISELMEAINTFCEFQGGRCFFVLGGERSYVRAGIESAYGSLAKALGEEVGEFGEHFLNRVVQAWLRLPEPDEQGMRRFLDTVLEPPQEASKAGEAKGEAAARQFSEKDPALREILAAGVQELEHSPRQVKLFLHRFRLAVLILIRRGEVLGDQRLREVALAVAKELRGDG